MHADGRFNPLEAIAQMCALVAVLWHWWRHDRKQPSN